MPIDSLRPLAGPFRTQPPLSADPTPAPAPAPRVPVDGLVLATPGIGTVKAKLRAELTGDDRFMRSGGGEIRCDVC